MALLPILTYPDPRLKQISAPVEVFDEVLRGFVRDLEETMRAGPAAVGIAAPQVGQFQRIVLVDVSSKPNVRNHGRLLLVNPEILSWEGLATGREGCLSGSGLHGKRRSRRAHHVGELGRVRTAPSL